MGMSAAVLALVLGFPWEPTRQPEPQMQAGIERSGSKLRLFNDKERYEPIPFEGNLDSILQNLLRRADEDEELNALFKKLRQNPKLKSIDAQLLRKVEGQARVPWLRSQLLELARAHKDGFISREALEQLMGKLLTFERLSKDIENFVVQEFRPAPELNAEERLERWTRDLLEGLDDTGAGEFLRESPAWQNALKSLEQYVKNADGRLDWLGRVTEGWRLPEAWRPRLGEWSARLPAFNLPDLPRWRISPPNLGRWNLDLGGGGMRMGAPSLGGVNVSDNLYWVLLLVLLALLGWVFYHKLGRAPAALGIQRRRGPWPVDPATVTTRTQLVQAFDYLALLLLGEEARTWNHVAVARKLSEAATRSSAAGALAQLYELARYTPGDDLLTPDAQAAARRHLVHLAGSAAA